MQVDRVGKGDYGHGEEHASGWTETKIMRPRGTLGHAVRPEPINTMNEAAVAAERADAATGGHIRSAAGYVGSCLAEHIRASSKTNSAAFVLEPVEARNVMQALQRNRRTMPHSGGEIADYWPALSWRPSQRNKMRRAPVTEQGGRSARIGL